MGANNGVLVRDRLALEAAREIDVVVFDKTGTLTKGQFGVVGIETAEGWDDDRALALAGALEGDSEHLIAQAIRRAANERGLDLPEHKQQHVEELQGQGKRVAMIGDGVNDAPALTRADVSIAIGGGTDVAIESAGIILVKSNPLDVVKVIALSRASYRKMIQNLWWAAGYNIFALPLAAGALVPWGISVSPAIAALLMSLRTVIVAVNAQTLRQAGGALSPSAI